MLRLYAAITILLLACLLLTMLITQQVGKLSNAPQFAYIGICRGGANIYLADYAHRITLALTDDGTAKASLMWSPNGAFLAYAAYGDYQGIHLITETGQVNRLTGDQDSELFWLDNTRLLFNRDANQAIFSATYMLNLETSALQRNPNIARDRDFTDGFSSTYGELRIFQWQVESGGTDDIYITDVAYPFNIRERYTFDGSDCYEISPQFHP